jgi:hypothetical protein
MTHVVKRVQDRIVIIKKFVSDHKLTFAIVSTIVLAIVFASLLYQVPVLRPYLVAFVAAVGALFAAMPGIFSDTPLVRWTAAIVGGVCVGAGTWYTATDLEERLRIQQQLNSAISTAVNQITPEERAPLLVKLASSMLYMFDHGHYAAVHELSNVVLRIVPENGHALNFNGEYWRINKNRENMRGSFKRYLAHSHSVAESRTGSRTNCYERASGYCAERTAWISHMMANDFYAEAVGAANATEKKDGLQQALRFARDALTLHRCGFEKTTSFESTIRIQSRAIAALAGLGLKADGADVSGCAS